MPKGPIYLLGNWNGLSIYVEIALLAFLIHFLNLQRFDLLRIKLLEQEGHAPCTRNWTNFLNIL